ncbi:MAG: DUF3301 domain-containing protein [Burkholderiales bacterium]
MWEVTTLVGLAALAWFWYDSMRAREAALAVGRLACQREGLQFLDDTVEMVKLRPARDEDGRAALRRVYRFEFSDTGNNRRRGSIVTLGPAVEGLELEPYRIQEPIRLG